MEEKKPKVEGFLFRSPNPERNLKRWGNAQFGKTQTAQTSRREPSPRGVEKFLQFRFEKKERRRAYEVRKNNLNKG